jgi:hypothetical protein
MFACLFFMDFDTVRANAIKLCRIYSFVQRKINDYFLPKKNNPGVYRARNPTWPPTILLGGPCQIQIEFRENWFSEGGLRRFFE